MTVLHSTEFILKLAEENRILFREVDEGITYHDPCDLGRVSGIYAQPRSIMARIPGLRLAELQENREYSACCGSGGDLLVSNQELSLTIAGRRIAEASALGVTSLVTACPSCVRSLTMAKNARKAPLEVSWT